MRAHGKKLTLKSKCDEKFDAGLYFMSDSIFCRGGIPLPHRKNLEAGVRILQLREKKKVEGNI